MATSLTRQRNHGDGRGDRALYAAITALVRTGDEVICFDPSYDSYAPAVELSGGVVKRVALQPPHFRPDWQALPSEKTRLVILNTPHNPSATVWQKADLPRCGRRLRNVKSTC
jgi:methionine aminotransferase